MKFTPGTKFTSQHSGLTWIVNADGKTARADLPKDFIERLWPSKKGKRKKRQPVK